MGVAVAYALMTRETLLQEESTLPLLFSFHANSYQRTATESRVRRTCTRDGIEVAS